MGGFPRARPVVMPVVFWQLLFRQKEREKARPSGMLLFTHAPSGAFRKADFPFPAPSPSSLKSKVCFAFLFVLHAPRKAAVSPNRQTKQNMCFAFIESTRHLVVFPYPCLHVESHTNTATALRGRDWGQLSCDDEGWVNAKDCVKYKEIKDLLGREQGLPECLNTVLEQLDCSSSQRAGRQENPHGETKMS